jgi:uncharacterized membrane protein YvbJ
MYIQKCKRCGITISDESKFDGLCENCYQRRMERVNNAVSNNNNSENANKIGIIIIIAIIIIVVILPIISLISSSNQDAEIRKQKELREFNKQLHQDTSTWNTEQKDRYDSFTEWNSTN